MIIMMIPAVIESQGRRSEPGSRVHRFPGNYGITLSPAVTISGPEVFKVVRRITDNLRHDQRVASTCRVHRQQAECLLLGILGYEVIVDPQLAEDREHLARHVVVMARRLDFAPLVSSDQDPLRRSKQETIAIARALLSADDRITGRDQRQVTQQEITGVRRFITNARQARDLLPEPRQVGTYDFLRLAFRQQEPTDLDWLDDKGTHRPHQRARKRRGSSSGPFMTPDQIQAKIAEMDAAKQ